MSNLKGINKARNGLSATPFLTSASVIAILFTAAPVAAQSSDTSYDNDEIIVTARKKEESLQEIPLAISAFSETDIRERSLSQLENVAMQTPGLTFEDFSNGGYGAPVIRGTSQARIDQLEQNVSVFYDGIYIPRQYAFDLGLTNVERIEVVKGPQSALYGANSFAGAINYVSKGRDMSELTGSVSAGAGLDGLLEANGYVSVPVIKDTLAVSLSGALTRFDGDWENSLPGAENAPSRGTDETVGGWEKETYGAGLTFQTGGLTAKLDYNKFDALNEDGPHYRLNRANRDADFNCSLGSSSLFFTSNPLVNNAFCGQLPNDPENIENEGPTNGLLIDPRAHTDVDTEIFRGELNYEVSDAFSLNYLFGRVESEVFAVAEGTRDATQSFVFRGTPLGAVFTFAPSGYVNYDSHEIRADFEFGNGIEATLGGYLLDGEDLDAFSNAFLPLFSDGGTDPIDAPDLSGLTPNNIDNKAVFGSINIPLMDERLNIGIEARYTETEKDATQAVVGTTPETLFVYEDSFFTPRVSLDFNVTDDNLLYATYAKGVKSGGVNTSSVELTDAERFLAPDKNTTYEIGSKNSILGGRGTFNIALYHLVWDNLQASQTPTNAGIFTSAIASNVGGATSNGVELDSSIDLSDNFTINGGFSYTDATYDDDTVSGSKGFLCPAQSVVCSSNANGDAIIGGNRITRVPKVQWNFGGQYNGSIGNDYDYFMRVDVAGQSAQFVSEVNLTTIEARELVNLRGGISKGAISMDLWVTNLTDREYVSNAFLIAAPFDTSYIPTLGAKRRGGVTLSYDF